MVTETFYPVSVWHFLLELCSRYYDNEYNRFEFNFWISWCLDFTEWDLQLYCDLAFPSCAYLRDGGRFLPLSSQKIKNKNAWSKVIWEWPSFDSECTKLWNISVGFSWPSPMSFLFTVISRQCYECLSLRSFEAKKTATPTEFRGIVCPKRVAKRKFTQHLVACTLIRMR